VPEVHPVAEDSGPQSQKWMLPVGTSLVPGALTVAVSKAEVPAETDPVWLDEVVVTVGATTWKHSWAAVVELEARKLLVSGV